MVYLQSAEAETTYKACVAEANNRQQALLKVKTELLAAVREQIYLSDQCIKKVIRTSSAEMKIPLVSVMKINELIFQISLGNISKH